MERPQLSPNYTFTFPFERDFQHSYALEWMKNRSNYPWLGCALYLIFVFTGRAIMSNRSGYKLKRLLTIWNVGLATFSIMGFLRTSPELFHVLKNFGFSYSVCNPSHLTVAKESGFWMWIFVISKFPELIDTVFIVLRKASLQFLHWYHHTSVVLFTWYTYTDNTAVTRWFSNMNYFVHSIMYSYYALKALGFNVPKQTAMAITTIQILQMIAGSFTVSYACYLKYLGTPCNISTQMATLSLAMYLSYLVLFAKFFYDSYFVGKKKRHQEGETTNGVGQKKTTRQSVKQD